MKNNSKEFFVKVIQNKKFYQAISIFICLGIIYYAYEYNIKNTISSINAIEKNISAIKLEELKTRIKKLEKEKKEIKQEYKNLLEQAKEKKTSFYSDNYDVVVDVINKLNSTSFNIYKYNLNDKYDEMDLELNGSYLNLIKFFDFLETIKAKVNIKNYLVYLKDEKMIVKLKLEVGVLEIK